MTDIPRLINKYLLGSMTDEERKTLDEWVGESCENQELFKHLTNLNVLEKELNKRQHIDTERPMRDMQARIDRDVASQDEGRKTTVRFFRRMAAAAAVALLLVGVGYRSYQYGLRHAGKEVTVSVANDTTITHGETKALLAVNNGEIIELGSDFKNNEHKIQQLLDEVEKTSDNTSEVPTLSLKTPRGGEFKVTLEDGTEVWLNAESQLQYPETFGESERRVLVSGEAYFKVAKDANRPFYVETAGQLVRVYGTEFNINSYEEDPSVYTTLVNGRIALSCINGNDSEIVLTPSHQSVFDKSDVSLSVRSVDASIVTSWRNGKFVFENQTLEQIMIALSRWYDFDYEFMNARLRNTIFMGSVPRYGEFNEVLSILEKSGGIHFTQKGKTIIINHK